MTNKLPSLISQDIAEFDEHIAARRGKTSCSRVSVVSTLSLHLLKKIKFPERVNAHIKTFLSVRRIGGIRAVGCSSSSNQFALEESLTCTNRTWWISRDKAPQYIQFQALVNEAFVVETIAIVIPPLPFGPLSVRTFSISYTVGGMGETGDRIQFVRDDRVFETKDDSGLQIYHLDPPIIVRPCHGRRPCVRVICKSTAYPGVSCVGFFMVRFG